MARHSGRRIELIGSLIRTETWVRDRIAGDVARASQLHANCRRENAEAERVLDVALGEARRAYGADGRLHIESMERARHCVAQATVRQRQTAQEERRAEHLFDDLRSQLERQALKIRGLERTADKQARHLATENRRRDGNALDELMLLRRGVSDD